MGSQSQTPTLSSKFADFQQADRVTQSRNGNTITVGVETKIPFQGFSSNGPLRAIMLSYEESDRNKTCSISFDCEDQSFVKDIRNRIFPESNLVSGADNTVAIDGIRTNEALDKLDTLFADLRSRDILDEEEPKTIGTFTTLAKSSSHFAISLDRALEKRDTVACEEAYKVGFEEGYDDVRVKLTDGAAPQWGQDLPDLTPLNERPVPKVEVGNYFD